MTDGDALERDLTNDLATLGERLVDEQFCGDLYRALAGNALVRGDGSGGRLSLSWRRSEELVNALRERVDRARLTLAQTGGEGDVSDIVAEELRRLGWTLRPRDTSTHDESHVASPPAPPPPEQGEHQAPVGPDETEWEERAHAEADAGERLHEGRPGSSAASGRDPEERAHPSS